MARFGAGRSTRSSSIGGSTRSTVPIIRPLTDGLDALRTMHGEALLLDCHSMPPRANGQADIVIGDRHGASAAGWISAEAAQIIRTSGFRAALNEPYAGGAIVARHGSAASAASTPSSSKSTGRSTWSATAELPGRASTASPRCSRAWPGGLALR